MFGRRGKLYTVAVAAASSGQLFSLRDEQKKLKRREILIATKPCAPASRPAAAYLASCYDGRTHTRGS